MTPFLAQAKGPRVELLQAGDSNLEFVYLNQPKENVAYRERSRDVLNPTVIGPFSLDHKTNSKIDRWILKFSLGDKLFN